MNHNPVQFIPKGAFIVFCIFFYRIDADVYITSNRFAFRIMKRNDVGKIVTGKIGFIELQNGMIIGKYNVYVAFLFLFFTQYLP